MDDADNKKKTLVRQLESSNLLNVVEPIMKSGAKAHLHVEMGFENGDFYFDGGRMVFARASAIKGSEAAYYLISWRNGTFALRKVRKTPEHNVNIEWIDFVRFYEEEIEKIVLGFVPEVDGGLYLEMRDQRGGKAFISDHLQKRLSAPALEVLIGDPNIEKAYPALRSGEKEALRIKAESHILVLRYLREIRYFVVAVFSGAVKEEAYSKWIEEVFEPRAIEAVSMALEVADKKRIRGTVLVIDDSPTTRAILQDTLTEYRFNVIAAEDGYEGLVIARDEMPDMIFLDVMMPKLDGYEVLKKIRKEEQLKNLPVVMLTSKGLASDKGAAFREGANLYIEKPFTTKKILAIVENVLGLE